MRSDMKVGDVCFTDFSPVCKRQNQNMFFREPNIFFRGSKIFSSEDMGFRAHTSSFVHGGLLFHLPGFSTKALSPEAWMRDEGSELRDEGLESRA